MVLFDGSGKIVRRTFGLSPGHCPTKVRLVILPLSHWFQSHVIPHSSLPRTPTRPLPWDFFFRRKSTCPRPFVPAALVTKDFLHGCSGCQKFSPLLHHMHSGFPLANRNALPIFWAELYSTAVAVRCHASLTLFRDKIIGEFRSPTAYLVRVLFSFLIFADTLF